MWPSCPLAVPLTLASPAGLTLVPQTWAPMGGSSRPRQWIQPETLPEVEGKGEEGKGEKGGKDEGQWDGERVGRREGGRGKKGAGGSSWWGSQKSASPPLPPQILCRT